MKRSLVLAAALLCAGAAALSRAPNASGQGAGWTALFDGKTIDNWDKVGDANWRVADGAIVADKATGLSFLVSKDNYTDMEIKAEFWVDADANSGVFVRITDTKKISSQSAYEINIYDKRPDADYGTGAMPRVAKALTVLKTANKWNTYEIRVKGPQFFVTLNGTKTVDGASDSHFPSGRVGLQYGSGVVKFRKFEIRPL